MEQVSSRCSLTRVIPEQNYLDCSSSSVTSITHPPTSSSSSFYSASTAAAAAAVSNMCATCRQQITDTHLLTVGPTSDVCWHVDCLQCAICRRRLTDRQTCCRLIVLDDGQRQVVCNNCNNNTSEIRFARCIDNFLPVSLLIWNKIFFCLLLLVYWIEYR